MLALLLCLPYCSPDSQCWQVYSGCICSHPIVVLALCSRKHYCCACPIVLRCMQSPYCCACPIVSKLAAIFPAMLASVPYCCACPIVQQCSSKHPHLSYCCACPIVLRCIHTCGGVVQLMHPHLWQVCSRCIHTCGSNFSRCAAGASTLVAAILAGASVGYALFVVLALLFPGGRFFSDDVRTRAMMDKNEWLASQGPSHRQEEGVLFIGNVSIS
jgi:hypothetical protein